MSKEYLDILEEKRITHKSTGFKADVNNPNLFPFQNFVVNRSLAIGKYAVFSGTGTGKTRMQLICGDEVVKHTGKSFLILAPLAVSMQTLKEGNIIGVDCTIINTEVVKNISINPPTIYITNYEQIENIKDYIYLFGGIALDEASIIKNNEGVYRNTIIDYFKFTQFKFCFSATPSPNSNMEIGNYCEFLDVMGRNEMLAMFFVHDAGETQAWRLKGHCKKIFWEWVSTWSIMFQNPRDIGFEMEGYDLPPLNLIERKITTDKRNNGLLFNDVAVSATTFNQELRITLIKRLDEVASIVNVNKENFLIWIKQNAEGDELRKLIPNAVEVKGSDTTEYKEEKLLGFAENKFPILISKTKICGQGMNYQNCYNQIFASLDFSFESLFQGIRRSWRFGQSHPVNVYIISTDTMENVIQSIKRKEEQFEEMQMEMTLAVTKTLFQKKKVKIKREFQQFKSDKFMYKLGDCVQLMPSVETESIGMTIFSPPFPTLYVYSDEIEDMGNCKDFNEFFKSFNFLTPELYRVTMSGRHVIVHCMDVPIQKGKEGYIGLRDFSGMIIESFQKAGFIYHSRVTLWKNPVTEMQRTKALGLLHKQVKKDAAMCRVGIPDYLLVFRKDGENLKPIIHQDKDPSLPNYLPVNLWQEYASPVWMDIDQGDTLNAREAKEENDERHIAPLQLQTINRCLHLWSNEDDTILTPYGGIGSEGYEAIKLKRKAILFELKKSYFDKGVSNCLSAEQSIRQKQLFA